MEFNPTSVIVVAITGGSDSKESACNVGDLGLIPGFDPWVGKIPWRRKWQPTPVFLSEESHGQRSLVGCSPWGCKESDTTERLMPKFKNETRWTIKADDFGACIRYEGGGQ